MFQLPELNEIKLLRDGLVKGVSEFGNSRFRYPNKSQHSLLDTLDLAIGKKRVSAHTLQISSSLPRRFQSLYREKTRQAS